METSLRNRLEDRLHEFQREHLPMYEDMRIESISRCTAEWLAIHCCSNFHESIGETKFKAVLELRYPEAKVLEYQGTDAEELFVGPIGLTLIMTEENVFETLWHGIDI